MFDVMLCDFLLFKTAMRPKSAMLRKVGTIEHEMDHQNQKNKMLEQDRRVFVKQAQEIKQRYQQQIEKMRVQNQKLKSVRDQLISAKKQRRVFTKTAYDSQFTNGKFHSTATDQNYLRIMLDKEKHETKIKKNMLYTLQDKLKEVEDNKIGYIEENPMMKTIRLLENRLDKVMIKYNEAQSIQQTYNQVVKRLKEQRVGYDSQLAAVQDCLKGKEHDFEELLLLAHDATHAKQSAFGELKRFQQRRVTVQQMRTKYLNEKKDEMTQDMPIKNSQTMAKNERSGYNKPTLNFGSSYKHDQNYQRQQLSDYQQAFRKLKEVTGVVDANQIIQKFKTQGLTTQSLEQMQQNYANKIQNLKEEKEMLKKMIQDSKFVRQQETPQRRRLDQIEGELAKVTNQFQRTSLKHNKLSNSMINIKAGISHLKELTAFYKAGQSNTQSLQSDLKVLSEKLRCMYDVVKNDPNYLSQNYKANAKVIQSRINESTKQFRKVSEEDSDQD